MSALQRRPATRVAPVMFAVQVLVPVALAPLIFGEAWAGTPLGGVALVAFMAIAVAGTVLLAGSRAVGAVIENARIADLFQVWSLLALVALHRLLQVNVVNSSLRRQNPATPT